MRWLVILCLGGCFTAGVQTAATMDRAGHGGVAAGVSGGLGWGWGGRTGLFMRAGVGGKLGPEQIASGLTVSSGLEVARVLERGPVIAAGYHGGPILSPANGAGFMAGLSLRLLPWARRRDHDFDECCRGGSEKGGIDLWDSVDTTRVSGPGILLAADYVTERLGDPGARGDWVFSVGLTWDLYDVKGHAPPVPRRAAPPSPPPPPPPPTLTPTPILPSAEIAR